MLQAIFSELQQFVRKLTYHIVNTTFVRA